MRRISTARVVVAPVISSDEALARRLAEEEEAANLQWERDEEFALALAREFEAAAIESMTEHALSYASEPIDDRPAVLSEADLQRLPTYHAGPRQLEEECPICFLPYEEGEELRALPCLHAFHTECIDKWLLSRRAAALTCPMCQTKVDL